MSNDAEDLKAPEKVSDSSAELCAGDVMSTHLLAVDGGDGLLLAWELVSQARVHQIPVIQKGRCIGLLSERDLAVEVARDPFGNSRRLVRELADDTVPFVTVDTPLPTVATRLLREGRDAIVVHDGSHRLVGLITVHDLLRVLAGEVTVRPHPKAWDQSVAMFRLTPVLPRDGTGEGEAPARG